ncbi:hypothetical protein IOCL2690_000144100, partial [Leishmania lindenbergi]
PFVLTPAFGATATATAAAASRLFSSYSDFSAGSKGVRGGSGDSQKRRLQHCHQHRKQRHAHRTRGAEGGYQVGSPLDAGKQGRIGMFTLGSSHEASAASIVSLD